MKYNHDGAGLAVYVVQCIATGNTVQVTDLGRAMITGKCADIGLLRHSRRPTL